MSDAPMSKILTAIAAAMGDVKKIGKGDRNKFDEYDFASIDKFLELTNPICAAHGLIVLSDETEREEFTKKSKNGEAAWLRVTFAFTVYHSSGERLPTVSRSVEVMRTGAQAYGSAQSYALKQFMRGLLLIPTGDKDDPDFKETDAGQVIRQEPETPSAETIANAIEMLRGASDDADLTGRWQMLPGHVRMVPQVRSEAQARKTQIAAGDIAGA